MNGLTESQEQTVKCFGYQMKSPTESGLKKKKKKQQQQKKKQNRKKEQSSSLQSCHQILPQTWHIEDTQGIFVKYLKKKNYSSIN